MKPVLSHCHWCVRWKRKTRKSKWGVDRWGSIEFRLEHFSSSLMIGRESCKLDFHERSDCSWRAGEKINKIGLLKVSYVLARKKSVVQVTSTWKRISNTALEVRWSGYSMVAPNLRPRLDETNLDLREEEKDERRWPYGIDSPPADNKSRRHKVSSWNRARKKEGDQSADPEGFQVDEMNRPFVSVWKHCLMPSLTISISRQRSFALNEGPSIEIIAIGCKDCKTINFSDDPITYLSECSDHQSHAFHSPIFIFVLRRLWGKAHRSWKGIHPKPSNQAMSILEWEVENLLHPVNVEDDTSVAYVTVSGMTRRWCNQSRGN